MQKLEYTFIDNKIVHVLQVKPSSTDKLGFGYILQTYHFGIDQVLSGIFENDFLACGNCKYSFNQNGGKSGKCYTHKGLIRLGLGKMLMRLGKIFHTINKFDLEQFNAFCTMAKKFNINLVRLGTYGDPILLPAGIGKKLVSLGQRSTSYTHQWKNNEMHDISMASVDSDQEKIEANKLGFRTFRILDNINEIKKDEIICPASKESKKKISCNLCGLCNGTSNKQIKNIAIVKH